MILFYSSSSAESQYSVLVSSLYFLYLSYTRHQYSCSFFHLSYDVQSDNYVFVDKEERTVEVCRTRKEDVPENHAREKTALWQRTCTEFSQEEITWLNQLPFPVWGQDKLLSEFGSGIYSRDLMQVMKVLSHYCSLIALL